jgi:hypothetical protein
VQPFFLNARSSGVHIDTAAVVTPFELCQSEGVCQDRFQFFFVLFRATEIVAVVCLYPLTFVDYYGNSKIINENGKI